MSSIKQWLDQLGLGDFVDLFLAEQVDMSTLPELTDDDLKDLGIPLGPRKKILKAIVAVGTDGALPPTAVDSPNDPQRRHLTVLFCDLVGSSEMSASQDPEDTRKVIIGFQDTCAGVIARYEGFLARFMGDGVLAYFGYPKAHEDDAERAVRAGLSLTQKIAGLSSLTGDALGARVGIASGLVVVGDIIGDGASQERAVVGDAPNIAARLEAIARTGQVVIAEATRRLLGADFEYADLGEHELKGIGTEQVTAVTGERRVENRFEATRDGHLPMVGRDQELALVQERWALAKAGEGQAVLLVGEAGIGKSRIGRSLLDALTDEPHIRVQYQCSPYHDDSVLWPVIRQLRHAMDFTDDEPAQDRLKKVRDLVQSAAGDVTSMVPLIAALLDIPVDAGNELPPHLQRARTLDALAQLLLAWSAQKPTLVILEDAHWIDATTLEFLQQLLERIASDRILVLITSRPEMQPELAALPHITKFTLNRLSRDRARAIIAKISDRDLPEPTIDAIIARTDGVPLFIEEMTKAVLETGLTNIPESLHDSLMARLDRIPEEKEIAQIAASIGREFEFALLAAVADRSEAELAKSLERLAAADLIFRRGTPPHAKYTFKHALVQDAAHNSLLRTRRRELHGNIAQTIEERFGGTDIAEPEVLANHYTQADQPGNAIPLWLAAGKTALGRMALVEAIAHLTRGLEVIEGQPPSRAHDGMKLEFRTSLGTAWMALKGWTAAEVWDNFESGLKLAKSLGQHQALVPIYYGLWGSVLTRGHFASALEWVDEILESARLSDNADLSIMGHAVACTTHYWRGEFTQSRQHGEKVVADYDPDQHGHLAEMMNVDPKTYASLYVSLGLWVSGYPDRALQMNTIKDEHARRHGHPFDMAYSLTIGSQLFDFRCESEPLLAQAKEAYKLGETYGLPFVSEVLAPIFEGIGLLRTDNLDEGIATLREATGKWTVGGAGGMTPYLRVALARGVALSGDLPGAMALVEQAAEQIARPKWEERANLAEVLRLKGQILYQQGELEASERNLLESLQVARTQGAKSWELRTATTLAQLWQSQDKQEQAKELLQPIYAWFDEGLNTHDLLLARSVLDSLSP